MTVLHRIATKKPDGFPGVGFIDSTGKIVVEPVYYEAHEFREDRAPVHVAVRGWGVIDTAGELVVEPDYQHVGLYSEGLCAVRTHDNHWGFVDASGHVVIEPRIRHQFPVFDFPYFSEGLCAVPSDDGERWGYIDKAGNVAIAHQFARAYAFQGGLGVVEDAKGRMAYIDRSGAFAFAGRYKRAWLFAGDYAAVLDKAGWGLIDKRGEYVQPPTFRHDERAALAAPTTDRLALSSGPWGLYNDRCLVQTDKKKWGYLGPDGQVAIAPAYEVATHFADGLAVVARKVKGKRAWFVIDTTGATRAELAIDKLLPGCVFGSGLVPAIRVENMLDRWGYVRADGEWALPPVYNYAGRFRDGIAGIATADGGKYIDPSGRIVWSAR